ncbi:MAG TPA: hypothetical protein VLL25_20235 [Acidimicrobiales bacterium]|nr:hypothetical protein [Acidimicrobiales bacterium]
MPPKKRTVTETVGRAVSELSGSDWMSFRQVVDDYPVTERGLRQLVTDQAIPYSKPAGGNGKAGRLYFRRVDVEAYFAAGLRRSS